MAKIIIKNCNVAELDIPLKYARKLYQDFAIRHPNAFYLRTRTRGMQNWDGKVKFISKTGQFKIGLLPSVVDKLESYGCKVDIVDMRQPVPIISKPITSIGKYRLRPEQVTAVASILNNRLLGKPFHIGVIDYTVNAGKCTGKGTLIPTNMGLIPIEDIVGVDGNISSGIRVLTKEGKLVSPKCGVYNDIKALKIVTNQGYQIICGYDNHRFYTITKDGVLDWRYGKELLPGDPIPLKMGYINEVTLTDPSPVTPDIAYLMGCIHGDGHVHRKSKTQLTVSISGIDQEIFDSIIPVWSSLCKTPVIRKPHKKIKGGMYISKSDLKFSKYLEDYFPELIGLSYDKTIPKIIMRSTKEVIINYIAGLFDTDGSNSSSRRTISFTSVNKDTVIKLQQLLLYLGIPSCNRLKKTMCNGKPGIAHRLTIHSEYYDDFLNTVPLRIARKLTRTHSIRNNYSKKLPTGIGLLISNAYKLLPYSVRSEINHSYDRAIISQLRKPSRVTNTACDILSKYDSSIATLHDFCTQVFWDKVESIEVIESYPCYDFHVPKYENYLSNGFLSHNTLIMSAIYLSFQRKLKTLLITQDSDWLKQAQSEFKEYLPGEPITFVQGSNVTNWSNFSIGMVQSISRNIKKYQRELAQVDMVLVDEADLAGSKTYQNVLTHLFNTRVRIGLSGTIYMSNLAKDKINNMNLESFFGKKIAEFRLKDSIKKGYSTNTIVKMVPANRWLRSFESEYYDYQGIYNDTITENPLSHKIVGDRLKYNLKYGRLPALVVCKLVKHAENIYKYLTKELADYKIAVVHVDTKTKIREGIMKDFREGKIDILVSTTIISRGKNFPLLRYMVIAGSMDSQERSIQFLGRLVRTHKSKKKAYLDDIHYPGDYLNRHGNHRRKYYQKEGLKVIQLDKLWKKYTNNIPNFE